MSTTTGAPAAGYKVNSFQEIKSHSSILFNERMAILFYLLDMRSIELNQHFTVALILEVRAIIKQIYKNMRTLLRNNPTMRATLNLNTKDEGIYVTDVIIGVIDKMIEYCEIDKYTAKRTYILTQELNDFEMVIKDVLQYYNYFIRPDFRQKPDVEMATEKYKAIADSRTVEELRKLVGKKHRVDFENLGTTRISLAKDIEFDPVVDEEMESEELDFENND